MSSKSDNDNRSNQLNPNNDAYYSSRGISRYDDRYEDDDYDPAIYLREIASNEAWKQREIEMRTPIIEEFTFDFMSMSGKKAHLKVKAQMPHKHYSDYRFSDCTDLIEKVWYPVLRRSFEQEANSPIAFLQIRDSNGNVLVWLNVEYRPRSISTLHHSPEQQQIAQVNELWEQSTRFKVDSFKKLLQNYKTIPREDVDFIVTPENYWQVSGTKFI